ncbi:unnamed protein product, partial [Didymodactylos carnosus]
LTFVPTLLNVIEQKGLSQILLRYINAKHAGHVQFNTYRILAVLMNETDIKTLTKPRKITALFKTFLEKLIDDPYRQLRLRSTLICLKTLVQHDEIKHEMVAQDVLPLLIRCATEPKFDVVQRQKYSLGLLWTMTFNDEVATILKENQKFMAHVKSLLRFDEQDLCKVADGIVWKLDKKAQFMAKQERDQSVIEVLASSTYKYDIMISYSHNDKDLCCLIQDKLTADGYRVWFDRDNLSGSIMQAMADAIENSYLVLILVFERAYDGLKKEVTQKGNGLSTVAVQKERQNTGEDKPVQDQQQSANKLDMMLALLNGINGLDLYEIYKMCHANDSMYQSLSKEMDALHRTVLPIGVFVRFNNELKRVEVVA